MPIRGYFEPRPVGALRTTLQGGLGGGISVQGPVLEGRMSVEEAILLNRIRGCDPPPLVDNECLQRESAGGCADALDAAITRCLGCWGDLPRL